MSINSLQPGNKTFTISNMMLRLSPRDTRGEVGILLIPLILSVVLLIGAIGFGLWSFSSREDYRKNTETKIAAAVTTAKQQEGIEKDKQHAEADKQPLKTYIGPEQYGSVKVSYPKTWSGYVITGQSTPFDAYFQPGVVPTVTDINSVFALRIKVETQTYASITKTMNAAVTSKVLTAQPYALPQIPSIVGIRYDGAFQSGKKTSGTIIVLPLRDKTLEIWTESPVYASDFTNFILPNISFSP